VPWHRPALDISNLIRLYIAETTQITQHSETVGDRCRSAIAAYIALFIDHSRKLAAGEAGYVLVLAPSRAQASLVFDYIEAFLGRSNWLDLPINPQPGPIGDDSAPPCI
jgi:hypothetical protein